MAKFVVRPEINGAVDGDYERLHQEIYARGFYRVILATPDGGRFGIWFDLPSGLYVGEFNLNHLQVERKAIAAITTVSNSYTPQKGFELAIFDYAVARLHLKKNKIKEKLPPGATPNA